MYIAKRMAFATVIFSATKKVVVDLLNPIATDGLKVTIEGNYQYAGGTVHGKKDSTSTTDFKELIDFILGENLILDGIKCWYDSDRWKKQQIADKHTYLDPGMVIQEGDEEPKIVVCIGDYLTNFSNISNQVDIPLKEVVEITEKTKFLITLHEGEEGKIFFFYNEKHRENQTPGIPKQEIIITERNGVKG